MQLSQKFSDARMQERELNRLVVQSCTRRRADAQAAVSSKRCASAGTDATKCGQDPAVETLEELADMGAFVIFTPTAHEWIQFHNQLRGFDTYRPFGSLPYLVHEMTDRLLLGIRVQRILPGLTTDLARR